MDLLGAIRKCALAEVVAEESSADYRLRRIFRWYSIKFSTPLHVVEELPIQHVLQHFFEVQYETKYDDGELEDLEQERVVLTETDDQRKERLAREAKKREEEEAFMRQVAAEEAAKAKPVGPKDGESGLPTAVPTAQKLPTAIKTDLADNIPEKLEIPPDISMKFDVNENDLDLDDAPDSLSPRK